MANLPKTFRDAVQITRALNIRYLWIDSLCIIQDDQRDWASEASQMGKYHLNSFLTLAADAARDGSQGYFPTVLGHVSHLRLPQLSSPLLVFARLNDSRGTAASRFPNREHMLQPRFASVGISGAYPVRTCAALQP